MKNRFFTISLLLAVLLSIIIYQLPVIKGIFPITFDQGRDFFWIKNQVDFLQPSLIGPWGSLTGVFFGPLWFWLLALPAWLSAGSPVAMTLFNALIVYATIILAAILLGKYSKKIGWLILFFGFISPGLQGISAYAFAQHLLPIFTFLLIFSYSKLLIKPKVSYLYLSCLLIGLMFHAEPPISIFSLPSLFLIVYFSKSARKLISLKTIFFSLIFFSLPFLPLIAFDIRHDFIQTKSIIGYLAGHNQSLGDILPFFTRLIDRPLKLLISFQSTVGRIPLILTSLILLFIGYFNSFKLKLRFQIAFWHASLIYILSLLVIFIIFPPEFKLFYLDGLMIIFVIWLAQAISINWLTAFLMAGLFIFNSIHQISADQLQTPGLYLNQKSIIDWVYQQSAGQGFSVYTYTPSVYDYPYQYLFFQYGLPQYGYLPEEFAYLPDQPEYVAKKTDRLLLLADKIKPKQGIIFLIIEDEKQYSNRLVDWLNHFSLSQEKIMTQTVFPDNTQVKKIILN